MAEKITVQPKSGLRGEMSPPGDKSVSHRSVMIGAIAEGITEVENFLPGEDCAATIRAFQNMGIGIEGTGTDSVRVHGLGLDGLKEPGDVLDMGNSGTSMRLISGILAGLFAEGETVVAESAESRDHTERMLRYFGAEVVSHGLTRKVKGRPKLTGQRIVVPGDISSASYFLMAAALCPDSEIVIKNVLEDVVVAV